MKRAMLAIGLIQISATVASAVSMPAMPLDCGLEVGESHVHGCVLTVVAEDRSQVEAVRT